MTTPDYSWVMIASGVGAYAAVYAAVRAVVRRAVGEFSWMDDSLEARASRRMCQITAHRRARGSATAR
jgi:hypothetical protein